MTGAGGLRTYREAFEEDPRYLNFASYGPPSRRALQVASDLAGAAAISAPNTVNTLLAPYELARASFGRLSGFPADQVSLIPSTSHGLLQTAFGLEGGEVLVGSGEFPANLYPWWQAGNLNRIQPRVIHAPNGLTADAVRAAIRLETTAVSVSAVDYRTGYRADLTAIRDVIGPDRILIVDGIQGFGIASIDWTAADVLIAGGQKWIRAGWGVGALAMSAKALDLIRPTLSSWAGMKPSRSAGVPGEPLPGAAGFGVTHLSPIAATAFHAALELIETVGVQTLEHAIAEKVDALIDSAVAQRVGVDSPRGCHERAGIVVLEITPQRANQVRLALDEAGFTYTWHEPDRLRVSIHATTSTQAIDQLVSHLSPNKV